MNGSLHRTAVFVVAVAIAMMLLSGCVHAGSPVTTDITEENPILSEEPHAGAFVVVQGHFQLMPPVHSNGASIALEQLLRLIASSHALELEVVEADPRARRFVVRFQPSALAGQGLKPN